MRLKKLFTVLLLTAACALPALAQKTQPAMSIKVMTFNLRFASNTKPHSWPERRPVNAALLRQEAPDLIGTQEGLYSQIKDIAADNPDYSWIGLGREGGSHGEFMAVFYRTARFEPLEYDHFWLSDTPNVVGSSTWGNANRRMVTWIKFRDRQTDRQFYFWNTHFDHAIQEAREKAAALVLQRVQDLKTDLPVILTGDFNAPHRDNKAYSMLTAPGTFTDAWFSAEKRTGRNYASFHGYEKPISDGPHIDWILSRGPVKSKEAHVVDYQQDGQYPSDHFPITATLEITG